MKILIIEDNPANMKFASKVLEKEGYEILQATDAEAGIRLARNEQPGLILMDIQLPGMNGMEAAQLLKSDDSTKNIPIIALTALAMKGDNEKILSAGGCDSYMAKPIRYKILLETVASYITCK